MIWYLNVKSLNLIFTDRFNRSVFHSRVAYEIGSIGFSWFAMNSGAERFNGLMAMIGVVAGIGAYATTGQIIPGIF